MRTSLFFKGQLIWGAALLAAFMLSHGAASAVEQEKGQQKCINALNKGAASVMKSMGGDIGSCLKTVTKGQLTGTIEDCITSDPKGKVSKARGKLEDKAGSGGECDGANAPDFAYSDPVSAGQASVDKELALVHAIFGTDLDQPGLIVVADKLVPESKDQGKCQVAVHKAVQKCQDTKMKLFAACKKNELKGKNVSETPISSLGELRAACVDGGIPDPKGKLPGKCLNGIGGTVTKKCAGQDTNALFPGCAGEPDLAACLDQKVECEVCRALKEIDGVLPNCDLFDNGVADGSCDRLIGEIGSASCTFDEQAVCMGGPRDGEPCIDAIGHSDCKRPTPPHDGFCIAWARAFLAAPQHDANDPAYADVNPTLRFPVNGELLLNCGSIDPNTGKAPCTCQLTGPVSLPIPPITQACLTPLDPNYCAPGEVDCDGGTGLNVYLISDHNIGPDVSGQGEPPLGPFTEWCGNTEWPLLKDPLANQRCAAMCELYCASLSEGSYTRFLSGCEGYCRGGVKDGEICQFSLSSQGSPHCQGPTLPESGFCVGSSRHNAEQRHPNVCGCHCLEVGGPPSPAGALYCQVPIRTIEIGVDENCLGADADVLQGQQCIPYTTESIRAEIRDPDNLFGNPEIVQTDTGTRVSCEDIKANNLYGFVKVGNVPAFDGQLGDSPVEVRQACEGADFGEPFARPPE